MPTGPVGSIFRDRREQLGIPIEVAADATNIRARLLQTIEASDFKNYPPHGHAVGMLSSYARYLQLDTRDILERYETEFSAFEAGEEMATSADRAKRGLGRFGERVSASDKPLPREGAKRSGVRNRRTKRDEDDSTSRLNEKLDKERVAEGDDRYKSGTVKVVGTRQTGSFGRIRPAGGRGGRRGGAAEESGRARDARSGTASYHDRGVRSSGRTRLSASRSLSDEKTGSGPGRHAGHSSSSRLSSRAGGARLTSSPAEDTSRSNGTSSRSAFERSREAARRHQEQMHSSKSTAGSESLSFFGGIAADADGASQEGRRRPRTHRVTQTEPADSSGKDTIVSQLLDLVKGVFSESRTRLIVLTFAVIIIGVVVAASVLISTAGNANTGVLDVQGGVEDNSTTTQGPDAATTTVTTTNGSPINVKIGVAEGQTSLINVTYDNDNAYSGTAVGPWERSFYVTDSLSASFGNAAAVTVTENGNPIQFETKEDGTGAFNLEITTTTSNTETKAGDSGAQKQDDGGEQQGENQQ